MRTYITFTCLFFLILTCHGGSILNHINIEKGISYLSDINENCLETCIYFVLANNPKYKTYTYDNIKSIFTAKYGKRPYSMFQIKAFLENLGISVVAKRLENKEDIFKFSGKYSGIVIGLEPMLLRPRTAKQMTEIITVILANEKLYYFGYLDIQFNYIACQ